ncbi:MAG: glycoside hydrolase family 3 C-terminal domain-containing protein, partial [Demequinaceae bacterium]|nr:glycoside hydrolase family 3 C-terminal domain-containing protein [Demequinaceae bacterium]
LDALRAGVESGSIPMDRIDEAVRRILTVKFEMCLFENPYPDPALLDTVGSAEHRALAREAVQKSLVLLENDRALPLSDSVGTIAVVGNAADDMGLQAGGWTMSWQGSSGPVIPGTTILEGITERAGAGVTVLNALPETGTVDVCVAAIGELPYAEGIGDSTDLALPGLEVLDTLQGSCDSTILVVVSGRPVIITGALDKVDAIVAAGLPGTAGEGIADALFGDVPFTGKLPMNWPRDLSQVPAAPNGEEYLYPIGSGITN